MPHTGWQMLNPSLLPQDAFYEFRLVAFAGSYISDPSNMVNVSTAGETARTSRQLAGTGKEVSAGSLILGYATAPVVPLPQTKLHAPN